MGSLWTLHRVLEAEAIHVVVHRTEGRIMIDSLEFGGESISLETPDGGIESVPVEPLADGLFDSKSRPLS